MKKDIHPKYKPFIIKFSDGTEFTTMSSADADYMIADNCFWKLPAWTGKGSTKANLNATEVSKFNKRFKMPSLINRDNEDSNN